ncbi:MAG: DUF362 domain-containing protein [Dehalococcoidales bacterium]|nr:DUF362 domain-containing protein [Dehalococcoidales bacterium]
MKNRVSIVSAGENGIEAAVRQAIDLAGGLPELITPRSRVMIKPNLFRPEPSGRGLLTDCRVTEAVTRVVLELKPQSVVIGEGAGAGYTFSGSVSTEDAFQVSGTAEVAARLGVELRNLNSEEWEEVPVKRPYIMDKVKIARTALESDVIISLPVLKTHVRTLVTLSLKNMKGVLPGAEKRKTHALGLDKAIADLNSLVKPSYVVVDALAGMQGLWEYPQDKVELGLILAGREPCAVDTVGTCLMGFNPAQIMHLQYFAARQRQKADLEHVMVVGEPLESHRRSFKSSYDVFRERYPGVNIIAGESACTGCYGELMGALTAMKEFGDSDTLTELTVILGNASRDEVSVTEKTVILGKCARKLAHLGTFAKGCPPMDDDIVRTICQTAGSDADGVIASLNRERNQRWEETKHLLAR